MHLRQKRERRRGMEDKTYQKMTERNAHEKDVDDEVLRNTQRARSYEIITKKRLNFDH